ncbi:MAG TPA: hypothetical protein VL688_00315 [Verrucomicrobiae bacterium]|nr:hypothetical protein [Verrucomicrobiae bacterium]
MNRKTDLPTRVLSLAICLSLAFSQALPAAFAGSGSYQDQEASLTESSAPAIEYNKAKRAIPEADASQGPSWEKFLDGDPLSPIAEEDQPQEEVKKEPEGSRLNADQKKRAGEKINNVLDGITANEEDENGVRNEVIFFAAFKAAVYSMMTAEASAPPEEEKKAPEPEKSPEIIPIEPLNEDANDFLSKASAAYQQAVPGAPSQEQPAAEDKETVSLKIESVEVTSGPLENVPAARVPIAAPIEERKEEVASDKPEVREEEAPVEIVRANSEEARQIRQKHYDEIFQMLTEYLQENSQKQEGKKQEDRELDGQIDRLLNQFFRSVDEALAQTAERMRRVYLPERARKKRLLIKVLKLKAARQRILASSRPVPSLIMPAPGTEHAVQAQALSDLQDKEKEMMRQTELLLRFQSLDQIHPWLSILMNKRMTEQEKAEAYRVLEQLYRKAANEGKRADARYKQDGLNVASHIALAAANLGPYLPPGIHYQRSEINEERRRILEKKLHS